MARAWCLAIVAACHAGSAGFSPFNVGTLCVPLGKALYPHILYLTRV